MAEQKIQSTTRESHGQTRSKDYIKLIRLYYHIDCNDEIIKLKEILELEGDINYRMPDSGCTALHFAADEFHFSSMSTKLLIDHGADPTITNHKGQTVVHWIINHGSRQNWFSNKTGPFKPTTKIIVNRPTYPPSDLVKNRYISLILASIHIKNKNTTNFRDPYGFSHFHAACMINDMEIVEFFLNNNGVSVDEAVSMDSPMYPGYTPLHFAVQYGYVELANSLLSHGANLMKNSSGMTPLHVLVKRNMEIIQCVNWRRSEYETNKETSLIAEMETNERIIMSILSMIDKMRIDSVGLFPFYVMHTLKSGSSNCAPNDIDASIDVDSTFWPGYTALHFAVRFDIDTVKLLLKNGANMEAKDANGVTPFDICVGRYSVEDIHAIISSNSAWRDILLTDGKTKLLELVLAMRDLEDFVQFLGEIEQDINNISIPCESPLWPGCTILHLAVTLSKKYMRSEAASYESLSRDATFDRVPSKLVEVCLSSGADFSAQDRNGSTPIHLAFRRLDFDNIYLLLDHFKGDSNLVDKDNVSYLHIACTLEEENLVKELIATGADINGAVSSGFQWDPEVQYFHNLSTDKHLHILPGSTPLHVAMMTESKQIVKLLMEAGADLNAKDVNGLTPIHRLFTRCPNKNDEYSIVDGTFLSQFVSKDCVIDGLSYLHIASHREFPKTVQKLLNLGADVNSAIVARGSTDEDRPFNHDEAYSRKTTKLSYFFNYYEGNTPLHMALEEGVWEYDTMEILISHGADVLAKNSKGFTPISKILEGYRSLKHYMSVMNEEDEKRLVDEMGLTKLHMACWLVDEKIIKDCLEKKANVNTQIHNDSKIWPGYTPLHLLVKSYDDYGRDMFEKETCRAMRLLLDSGADVMIANAKGETPLMLNIRENHIESRPRHINILWKKLKGSVANPVSDQGISHFHLACIRNDVALAKRFLKLGVDANQTVDYFTEDYPGYTPLHFATCRESRLLLHDLPPLRTINLLLEYGANVHALDVNDDTPLHIAAAFPSVGALPYKRLFWAGADPEAETLNGITPHRRLFMTERMQRMLLDECRSGCEYLIYRSLDPVVRCLRGMNRKVRQWNAKRQQKNANSQ